MGIGYITPPPTVDKKCADKKGGPQPESPRAPGSPREPQRAPERARESPRNKKELPGPQRKLGLSYHWGGCTIRTQQSRRARLDRATAPAPLAPASAHGARLWPWHQRAPASHAR